MCISQACLEQGPGLAGIHVWNAHEREQVLAHPRRSHLPAMAAGIGLVRV